MCRKGLLWGLSIIIGIVVLFITLVVLPHEPVLRAAYPSPKKVNLFNYGRIIKTRQG